MPEEQEFLKKQIKSAETERKAIEAERKAKVARNRTAGTAGAIIGGLIGLIIGIVFAAITTVFPGLLVGLLLMMICGDSAGDVGEIITTVWVCICSIGGIVWGAYNGADTFLDWFRRKKR